MKQIINISENIQLPELRKLPEIDQNRPVEIKVIPYTKSKTTKINQNYNMNCRGISCRNITPLPKINKNRNTNWIDDDESYLYRN